MASSVMHAAEEESVPVDGRTELMDIIEDDANPGWSGFPGVGITGCTGKDMAVGIHEVVGR